jgi:hypothetical protein
VSNEYHFLTRWRVPRATVEEVFAVLVDAEALPNWWPSVYLAVTPVGERAYDLYTKGWLPYTLRWRLIARDADPPHRIEIGAEGDFVGRGIWTLTPDGEDVAVTFDWKLLAEKPLLRLLTPLLRPAFSANHRWAMGKGQISLIREVRRRQGRKTTPPPGPTSWEPWAALLGAAALMAGLAIWARRNRP